MNDDEFNPNWKDNNVQILLKELEEKGDNLSKWKNNLSLFKKELLEKEREMEVCMKGFKAEGIALLKDI